MTESGTNLQAGELHIEFDRASGTPMHVQLETGLRDAIRSGRLAADTALPATRRLADQFELSRGVVVEAYQQLTSEGYLIAQPGGYTRVARDVAAASALPRPAGPAAPRRPDGRPALDFAHGRPDVSQFPRTAWLRALRTAISDIPNDLLGYPGGHGTPELRAALAEYLNRVRGTWAHPDDVIPCSGYTQACAVLFAVLADRGVRRLAVEDPGDLDTRVMAVRSGLEVVGIPVTSDGIDVVALRASGAEVVLVAPAHQFPTGSVMSPETRSDLLAWAREGDHLIIEDDYDAENRYDSTPVGSLHGLAPDRVVYSGTTSKTLAPALRIGWMIAPPHLVDDLVVLKRAVDGGEPVIEQLAFAEFLRRGEYDRHLRKMRPVYRRRRDLLLSELAQHLPHLKPGGIAAGLHVYCPLPRGVSEQQVSAHALAAGAIVNGAGRYHVDGVGPGALILGYGLLDDDGVRDGVQMLCTAIEKATM